MKKVGISAYTPRSHCDESVALLDGSLGTLGRQPYIFCTGTISNKPKEKISGKKSRVTYFRNIPQPFGRKQSNINDWTAND